MSSQRLEPIQQARTRAMNLERTLDSVRNKATLSGVYDALEDIDSQLNALPGRLARVRSRGYVFQKGFESEIEALRGEWPATRLRVRTSADEQRPRLSSEMEALQQRFVVARSLIETNAQAASAALATVEGSAEVLSKSADGVLSTLDGMYDDIEARVKQAQSRLQKLERVLDHTDQASFKLYPEENVIDAIEAQWLSDQKGGPKGVLFCTDHRLLFEQKEDVPTKRVLFVVTQKEKVQKLALEAPIGTAQEIKESESGALLFRRDHLELTFGPGSRVRSAHFILKGDSAAWQRLINRVNAGEMDKERVGRSEAAAEQTPIRLPSQCPACGAGITQVVVRGMQSIRCQYCGTVIPVR